MKTKLIISIIGITIVSGILISTSGIFTPLQSDLADCSYTDDNGPPRPCRIIDGWYDALFFSKPLPIDESESFDTSVLERFKDKPEVTAFYAKYNDANAAVREDHVSYFAGNEADFRVRMNLYFDESYEIDHIDFHCYVGREHQTEVPPNFILRYLKEYDCEKYSANVTEVNPAPEPVKITGSIAFQICAILKIPCSSEPSFDAFYNSQTNTTTLQYFLKPHKYDFTIDDKRICYSVDGLDYQECPRLKAVIPSTLDGNNSLLLSKTLDEWTQMSEEELWPYYEQYGDDFFTELGKFLIKNEMKKELERQNIVNKYDDFTVFAGGMLTSLPPHIGYQAIVNATDGKSYLLSGGTYSNTVKNIVSKELIFYDVSEDLPIDSLFTQQPLVTILPENGTNSRSEPHDLVIHLDEHNIVTFYNSMSVPVRVQESGSGKVEDEDNLKWKTQIIGPNQTATVSFNATGHYEWDARFPPTNILGDWWESHTGGDISIISNETSNLEFQEKLRIAGSIIKNSEIPWTGLGMGNNRGLTIDFNPAIFHMLPDTTEYYTARAHQLIPFDVPVIIEAPDLELG